ncbi:uncharacterized protein LOC119374612 [Rhipicephalus sanguineus]|uniref:uncharacterized protein LOC119374612 n=1 Tax=Rhipicephalus sanguineus TaxID=34632 RepID=UPI001893FDB9|nr:uncharacterized protein LOC119374612 [Rhipicephalus sanguineus]
MQSVRLVAGAIARLSRQQSTSAAASSAKTVATGAHSRRMKYPYTASAKIAQFPYKFHFQKFWLIRYFFCGGLVLYMVFMVYPINKAVNSPQAVAAHRELMRKQAEEHQHH